MAWLLAKGVVTSVAAELRSGKEATVYLAHGPAGALALKVFRDRSVRSFKRNERYQPHRQGGDRKLTKAIAAAGGRGRRAETARWALHEYRMLWRLFQAGLPVPEPLVGPGLRAMAKAGDVLVMRYLGDEDAPAPRVADAGLTADVARAAFARSVEHLRRLWQLGVVHGDYSTYNLLWWQGEVVVIDLPQAVVRSHPQARTLLRRDVTNLCDTFAALGVETDARAVMGTVRAPPEAEAPTAAADEQTAPEPAETTRD
jgi:RIO kinase 1